MCPKESTVKFNQRGDFLAAIQRVEQTDFLVIVSCRDGWAPRARVALPSVDAAGLAWAGDTIVVWDDPVVRGAWVFDDSGMLRAEIGESQASALLRDEGSGQPGFQRVLVMGSTALAVEQIPVIRCLSLPRLALLASLEHCPALDGDILALQEAVGPDNSVGLASLSLPCSLPCVDTSDKPVFSLLKPSRGSRLATVISASPQVLWIWRVAPSIELETVILFSTPVQSVSWGVQRHGSGVLERLLITNSPVGRGLSMGRHVFVLAEVRPSHPSPSGRWTIRNSLCVSEQPAKTTVQWCSDGVILIQRDRDVLLSTL